MDIVTVQELINHLQEIEDKTQAVVYQYYLAEHFDVSNDTFNKVASTFGSLLPHDYDVLADTVADLTEYDDEEMENN